MARLKVNSRIPQQGGAAADDTSAVHARWLTHCTTCAGDIEQLPQDIPKEYLVKCPGKYIPMLGLAKVIQDKENIASLYTLLWTLLVNSTWALKYLGSAGAPRIEFNFVEQLRCPVMEPGMSAAQPSLATTGQVIHNLAHYVARRSARRGCAYELTVLLDKLGVDITKKDEFLQTPLFFAARSGNVECAAYLITAGCRAHDVDQNGQTPLFYAVLVEKQEPGQTRFTYSGPMKFRNTRDANNKDHVTNRHVLVDLLLNCACDPHHKDHRGLTALDYCIDDEFVEHLKLRLAQGDEGAVPVETPEAHMPPVHPPYLYMSQPNADNEDQVVVTRAVPGDEDELGKLEDQFVSDHQILLQSVHGFQPHTRFACDALGLQHTKRDRMVQIRDIDCMKNAVTYTTFKATSINFKEPGFENLFFNSGRNMAGYLAISCQNCRNEDLEQVSAAIRNGEAAAYYKDNSNKIPYVNIRYLKVDNLKRGQGIGKTLVCGMLAHLKMHQLELLVRDMRILAFANNASARRLYEKLGFVQSDWKKPVKQPPASTEQPLVSKGQGVLGLKGKGTAPAHNNRQDDAQGAESDDDDMTSGIYSSPSKSHWSGPSKAPRPQFDPNQIRWRGYRRVDLGPNLTVADLIIHFESAMLKAKESRSAAPEAAEMVEASSSSTSPPAVTIMPPTKHLSHTQTGSDGAEDDKAWTTLEAICGIWRHENSEITVESNGRTLYKGKWYGARFDLDEVGADGTKRILRRDGWTIDQHGSSTERLKWCKAGEEPIFWHRHEVSDVALHLSADDLESSSQEIGEPTSRTVHQPQAPANVTVPTKTLAPTSSAAAAATSASPKKAPPIRSRDLCKRWCVRKSDFNCGVCYALICRDSMAYKCDSCGFIFCSSTCVIAAYANHVCLDQDSDLAKSFALGGVVRILHGEHEGQHAKLYGNGGRGGWKLELSDGTVTASVPKDDLQILVKATDEMTDLARQLKKLGLPIWGSRIEMVRRIAIAKAKSELGPTSSLQALQERLLELGESTYGTKEQCWKRLFRAQEQDINESAKKKMRVR